MEAKHTTTPWTVEPEENGVEWVVMAGAYTVAVCCDAPGDGNAADNAAFIARACNAHDDLVAANARLWANASELLELLTEYLNPVLPATFKSEIEWKADFDCRARCLLLRVQMQGKS